LGLNVSGFDTTKLTAGLDPAGVFALVGKVRHRGVEVSFAGKVIDGTSVVLGAMLIDPKLSSPLVDAGLVSSRPVGVSSSIAFGGLDHKFSWAPDWAFDARMSWQAGRSADSTNTYGPKGFVMASFGARYNFMWGEQQAQVRLLTSNLLGGRPFIVGPSGLFNQFGPGAWRATLRVTF
jgi:iron complex outermembrane receptor protein